MSLAKRGVLISALVTSLGAWVFWWGTDGFTAFTAETARRVEILRSPRALPDVTLEDQNGKIFRLKDYQGKLLAVDFIFTRCTTLCRSMGMIFKQIRDLVPEESLGRDFVLISISFDPEHDDPAVRRRQRPQGHAVRHRPGPAQRHDQQQPADARRGAVRTGQPRPPRDGDGPLRRGRGALARRARVRGARRVALPPRRADGVRVRLPP